jgi:hypothetical protein
MSVFGIFFFFNRIDHFDKKICFFERVPVISNLLFFTFDPRILFLLSFFILRCLNVIKLIVFFLFFPFKTVCDGALLKIFLEKKLAVLDYFRQCNVKNIFWKERSRFGLFATVRC